MLCYYVWGSLEGNNNNNSRILLYNNIFDKISHIITQHFCSAYGDGRRECDGGGRWHTLFSSPVLHDSLLKENRHFNTTKPGTH